MNRTLTLSTHGGCWHVTDTDPEVSRLFGTSTLPTPFRDTVRSSIVVARLSALNPDATIVVSPWDDDNF